MNMSVQVDFLAGTDISHAGEEALQLANRIQCDVSFHFNSVHVRICPGCNPAELPAAFHDALGTSPPRVVVIKPRPDAA